MFIQLIRGALVTAVALSISGIAQACDNEPPVIDCSGGFAYQTPAKPTVRTGSRSGRSRSTERQAKEGQVMPVGSCVTGSVRGTAFEDLNANGKRDAGEPTMAGAWLKVTGGGSWFVCAYTGADATYAIPVVDMSATYIIFPIAPVGWKTTTPVLKTKTVSTANGLAYLYNDMGFVRDASVKTVDGCDQYNPSRPVPPGP